MFDGGRLYDLVGDYAAFGNHHTGTPVDEATAEWLTGLLHDVGASVVEDPYTFDRFAVAAWSLTVDGRVVPSLPLFHSATGWFDTDDVEVRSVDRGVAGSARGLEPHLAAAGNAEAIVLVLDGPDDLPVQCNRVPSESLGRPALVAAGNWLEQLRSGAPRVQLDATSVPARSSNVLAVLGPTDAPTVNVTTPLTGWTPAAGERGTGLAAALAIAVDLSRDHRVEFSACSGHEIDHLGLRHLLNRSTAVDRPTIHLGASIGAVEHGHDGPQLTRSRVCLSSADGPTRDELTAVVAAANWTMVDLDPPWPGEGGTWRAAGAPVLSFLGSFSLFHTEHDTPERATTPDALEVATNTAIEAARRFCETYR